MRRKPTNGVWMTVRNIPASADEEYVIAKFAEGGIYIEQEQISIEPHVGNAFANCIVSLSKPQTLDLVERAMHGTGLAFLIPEGRL